MDTVHTDLSKAFDCISREKLLIKMYTYDINPNICAWICDFLTNRRQRGLVKNCMSQWPHGASNVPQDSVLVLILFLFSLMTCLIICSIPVYNGMQTVQKYLNL